MSAGWRFGPHTRGRFRSEQAALHIAAGLPAHTPLRTSLLLANLRGLHLAHILASNLGLKICKSSHSRRTMDYPKARINTLLRLNPGGIIEHEQADSIFAGLWLRSVCDFWSSRRGTRAGTSGTAAATSGYTPGGWAPDLSHALRIVSRYHGQRWRVCARHHHAHSSAKRR